MNSTDWTSIEESPKISELYNVCWQNKGFPPTRVSSAFYNAKRKVWSPRYIPVTGVLTLWQPLPEPPEEQK